MGKVQKGINLLPSSMPMSELLEQAVKVESHLHSTLSWAMLVAAITSNEGWEEGQPSDGSTVLELRDSICKLVDL